MPPKGTRVKEAMDCDLIRARIGEWEAREAEAQRSVMQQAQAGSESAKRVLERMGMHRWEHEGQVIVGAGRRL